MSTPSSHHAKNQKNTSLSILGNGLQLFIKLFWLAFFAWVLLLFLISLSAYWFSLENIRYFLRSVLLTMTSHLWLDSFSSQFSFSAIGLKNINLSDLLNLITPAHTKLIEPLMKNSRTFWEIALLVTQLIVLRMQLFAFGTTAMIAASFMGLVDGLVKRDLRKFHNARESTLLFHCSKAWVSRIFFTGYFIFIIMPYPIDLSFWMMMLSGFIGVGVYLTTQQFKKYL